ncbi:glycoside hydrolase family 94 protein [Limnovirga soli]|uniref:Cyclic beta 1-2 glucan synthetase n=1 Tax=Limnovirga soli TaxID=2656915 RepID=A0A8J8FFA9_9BACT|nr:glycoside hydrolase family 94 protein [Limnovirga soli]NNV54871.1 cyclic beta 1-2 glucan synthetase [Limnovirga soli]
MKLIPSAHEIIANMRSYFQTTNLERSYLNEEPLRAELYSSDQMDRFGIALAGTHQLNTNPLKNHLLGRLAENEIILDEVRKLLNDSIKRKYHVTPAGEWLIDNYYLIEEHIRIAKTHFPKNYSETLPQLLNNISPGEIRIYDIVLQIISHSDGRIDMERLGGFIKSYQTVTNLLLGELWAIPIMLRLALIENIRRVSARIAIDRVDRNLADYWALKMIETAEKDPKNLILVIADMSRSNPPISSAFVSELTRQFRGKGPGLALALNWVEQQLSETGLTSNELINAENQKQAANQVSISNSIGSLRLLGAMDWRDFVENHSIVEKKLREDNNGIYSLMDFATRDRYRHIVENIAKKSTSSEFEVACIAIQLMQEHIVKNEDEEYASHVGYYLIGEGVAATKKMANFRAPFLKKIKQAFQRHNFFVYLTSIIVITIAISALILKKASAETNQFWLLGVIVIFALLCASQLAISVTNFFSTLLVKPYLLPRMDFSIEIPSAYRTLVVIPVMLINKGEIENLLEALEIRFLANRNKHLHFGLLTDFTDASQEILDEDSIFLTKVSEGILALNKKYQREENDLFYLFHRPRKWNPQQNTWMGYERKRGKISDLNGLLRGSSKECFSFIIGDQSVFPLIRFVITLDADTHLPLDTAWKLIGTMAHPLNRAWYNPNKKRITKGYGILQPRVTVSLPDNDGSLFTRMHGNEAGIDPYTRASSDVYQDLFSEGSFIGKGIYEIDIFRTVLDGKFAENSILSHDLLEGCYLRSGLVSDVQLFEKYPATYRSDMTRNIRWVRGDWQILSWMFPFVPGSDKHSHKNPLSALSRWKIFDNIRRSLIPLALTGLMLSGWMVLTSTLFWTILVTSIILIPIFISSAWDTIKKPKDIILLNHLKNSFRRIIDISGKTLFNFICFPYEAYANCKAIFVTIWRMLFTRKKMLEWHPFSNNIFTNILPFSASYYTMWVSPFLSIALFTFLLIYLPSNLIVALPVLLLWFIAPFITWWISKPLEKQVAIITDEQTNFLHKIARKTWGFFDSFVKETGNWLPPDNFQQQPIAILANRTSPTNIGIALLSNLTAYEFGYISISSFIQRTKDTLQSMTKMERFKGHFYNWYNIETLTPLQPKYISTVDSGNLIGHLMVLKQGIISLPNQKITGVNIFKGIRDTLLVLTDTLDEKDIGFLTDFRKDIDSICKGNVFNCDETKLQVTLLALHYSDAIEKINIKPESETYWWNVQMLKKFESINKELEMYNPWFILKDAPQKFASFDDNHDNSTLFTLTSSAHELQKKVLSQVRDKNTNTENEWLTLLEVAIANTIALANENSQSIEFLLQQCEEMSGVEWDFLYDKTSNLFTIGYNVQDHHTETGFYDLLASEARLCTYIGIAQGKLPEKSWFSLGRLLTNAGRNPILLSWSGSMFEYLMPLLVMPSFENTLLDQTCKAAVDWQIRYGKKMGKPWGISESGYNMVNANSEYQYRAFGAPGLGLKRGLEEDFVIAPYASALALMVSPKKACENLELLTQKGFEGRYGFYEAIDYTPSRQQRGQSNAIIYSFMAHHQGMTLLSLANLLLNKPLQKLFESEPQFRAILLLLQERIPTSTIFHSHTTDIADISYLSIGSETLVMNTADTPLPEVQLLSNGRYHVMVTNAGGGYSRWKELAVTRWREDCTQDNWGTFCYLQDLETGKYWSNMHQPTLKKGEKYEAAFSQSRVDFHTLSNEIECHTEIVVSPEDDIEMRRVTITNCSNIRKTIAITSYAELVIAPAASDIIQPAFSNLFVQTEILPSQHTILCTRRPRSVEEKAPWMFHLLSMEGKHAEEISYETDRMKFIGRGNTSQHPQAMKNLDKLSGSQGSVLDPIAAIRYRISLAPDESVAIDLVTGIAETREGCQGLINKYQDNKPHKDRVFEMAWTHSQVVLRQINASEADAQLYGRLASSILFTNASLRAEPAILINNHRQQSGLWGYSISGDLPIVLLKIAKQVNMQLVIQMVQAHAYWRLKGLQVDLVIWNEEHSGYRQIFQNEIGALIPVELKDRPGGIFVRASDQISNEDRILFETVARINISDNGGTLADHVKRKQLARVAIPYAVALKKYEPSLETLSLPDDLVFLNDFGGFSPDGSEYIIGINNKKTTPAPWVNVLANPDFGTVVSESGSAYTWTENAHELRLTPWHNDPVSDKGGEVFYLRDEETGHYWTTTLLPAGGSSLYITRHGFGYSIFEHLEAGIYTEMCVFVDIEEAVKFTILKIRNQSGRPRKLSATGYTEWVLGDTSTKTAMHIHTEIDADSGALFAKNPYSTEFSKRVAFFDVDYIKKTYTADRSEFIGRNGSLRNPDAMRRIKLSGKVGLALDPCSAIQVPIDLLSGEEQEIVFRLGAGKDNNSTSSLVRQFQGATIAQNAFEKVKKYWASIVGTVQVETPDTAINIITNGWLTYQTISSRLWGRSGFYQSGGAFGFRDQLQDVLSLLHAAPQLARKQIIRCAQHQFKEGDVQHWWHPPIGRGVRTRITDDFLWLPFVTSLYISHTGDNSILNESASFLDGRMLNQEEHSYFDLPIVSDRSASIYDHCVLAIKHAFNYGVHGLPLIGGGDWNDGFDKVGEGGKGESVWMAFFLYEILMQFSHTAVINNDTSFAGTCQSEAAILKQNIENHAWDGDWYKRAWFDDGTPLGSIVNEECKIDSIAQSWSVLSGAGTSDRMNIAMESAYNKLVEKETGIIKLLEPSFDKSALNPGYIKGYVPGIRENGGQYTHAAIWMIMAFAKLNNNERVWELLQMINPINHGKTAKDIGIYKVEPYVIAADVYAGNQHAGRGGWTWYTGSAGWMYRLITESFLGIQKSGNELTLMPCIPKDWELYKVHYRYMNTMYHIAITKDSQIESMEIIVDGVLQANAVITLNDDTIEHMVEVLLPR